MIFGNARTPGLVVRRVTPGVLGLIAFRHPDVEIESGAEDDVVRIGNVEWRATRQDGAA